MFGILAHGKRERERERARARAAAYGRSVGRQALTSPELDPEAVSK